MTERFRINGSPVSDDLFLHHFWSVWDGLVATKHLAGDNPPIPSYFRFLTLVAYHMFLKWNEKIDVVILEVGMGGKLDSTNIIHQPVVCGISSIGYDHMEILGYTLTAIAHEKAGIIKANVPVISVASQTDEVKAVFEQVASSESAPLSYVAPLDASISLGLAGSHQRENAALASALARQFLLKYPGSKTNVKELTDSLTTNTLPPSSFRSALASTTWPGRCQVLKQTEKLEFLIDGAHTDGSMKVACEWVKAMELQDNRSQHEHQLLFNCGHVRDPIELMIPIVQLAYPTSSTEPSSSSQSPIYFTRLISAPFDHDRPHITGAPSFEKLLQTYLLPAQRSSNVAVASGSVTNASESSNSIHPVIAQYLTAVHSFPPLPLDTPAKVEEAARVISQVVKEIETESSATIQPIPNVTLAANVASNWQHTVFRVWNLLHAAFRHAHPDHQSQPLICTFAPTVSQAIDHIQLMADKNEKKTTIFVTGSLYLVGNVLSKLQFRI